MTTKQQEEEAKRAGAAAQQRVGASQGPTMSEAPKGEAPKGEDEGKKALEALKELFEKVRASNAPLSAPDYDAITKHLKALEKALG